MSNWGDVLPVVGALGAATITGGLSVVGVVMQTRRTRGESKVMHHENSVALDHIVRGQDSLRDDVRAVRADVRLLDKRLDRHIEEHAAGVKWIPPTQREGRGDGGLSAAGS